ncbi:MAG: hypothetical protein ACRELT_08115 [Longimicrobiales bacterium]
MTALRPRSGRARYGLLIVAVIHVFTAATLSITHGHAPPAPADQPVIVAPAGDSGAQPAHADICIICQTFGSQQLQHTTAQTFTLPAAVPPAAASDRTHIAAARTFSIASPRAPPRA